MKRWNGARVYRASCDNCRLNGQSWLRRTRAKCRSRTNPPRREESRLCSTLRARRGWTLRKGKKPRRKWAVGISLYKWEFNSTRRLFLLIQPLKAADVRVTHGSGRWAVLFGVYIPVRDKDTREKSRFCFWPLALVSHGTRRMRNYSPSPCCSSIFPLRLNLDVTHGEITIDVIDASNYPADCLIAWSSNRRECTTNIPNVFQLEVVISTTGIRVPPSLVSPPLHERPDTVARIDNDAT